MNQKNLKTLLNKLINEYTGTGDMASTGATSDDGNNITSPRPYYSDAKEKEEYMKKNVYGGEGGHYRNNVEPVNYNNLYKPITKLNIINYACLSLIRLSTIYNIFVGYNICMLLC